MVRRLSISSSSQSGNARIVFKLRTMVRQSKTSPKAEALRVATALIERPIGIWRRRRDTY